MKVQKIHHVSIMVKDLSKARKLFADLFDIEFSGPYENEALDVSFLTSPIGINLATPFLPDGPSARVLTQRGEGLAMLVLNVPDLEEAIVDMESHGIRLIGREDRISEKVASFHPNDLHGVMIELTQEYSRS